MPGKNRLDVIGNHTTKHVHQNGQRRSYNYESHVY